MGKTARAGAALLAIAAAGLLAGCSDGDSTASSTPTLSSSKSIVLKTVPQQTGPRSATATSRPSSSAQPPSATSAAAAPSGFPGPPGPPPPGAKEQAYLDELKNRGVTPARKENALTIASMVCQGVREGKPDAQLAPYVNATAGSDGGGITADRTVEQVGQIYIAVARAAYCK